MSEMVDQVAKSLCDAEAPDWADLHPQDRERYRFMARAAIEGMVDPTDDMLRAYYETKCPPGESPLGHFSLWARWEDLAHMTDFKEEMRRCWRAAIETALNKRED